MLKWQAAFFLQMHRDIWWFSTWEWKIVKIRQCVSSCQGGNTLICWHKNVDQLHKYTLKENQGLLEDHSLNLFMCPVVSESRICQNSRAGKVKLQVSQPPAMTLCPGRTISTPEIQNEQLSTQEYGEHILGIRQSGHISCARDRYLKACLIQNSRISKLIFPLD